MKTKTAPKGAQAKKTEAKAVTPPPVVKFKEGTLQTIGFNRGETTALFAEGYLNRIGSMLHKRGLTATATDWWLNDEPVRFRCHGRDHEMHVNAYCPMAGKWQAKLIQGPTELEEWLEKRPEGHPERTSEISATFNRAELAEMMASAKRQGVESFEDFINLVLKEAMERDKALLAGLAPMHFDKRMVRYFREFCAVADVDADEWAESWIAVHLHNASIKPSEIHPSGFLMEGIIGDLLAPGHYPHIRNKRKKAEAMGEILERYRAEIAKEEGGAGA